MRRIDLEGLRDLALDEPAHCAEAVRQLGALAPWLLAPEVKRRASEDRYLDPASLRLLAEEPGPQDGAGRTALLFTLQDSRYSELLREAFALPVAWNEGHDGAGLPEDLRQVAASVRAALRVPGYGLSLDPLLGAVDLSGWPIECASGWPQLAGALELLHVGGRPRPDVWATACWTAEGGIGVDRCSLPAKVRLVEALGGTCLFVAPGDAASARCYAGERLRIEELRIDRLDPREALAGYLRELEVPPSREQPLSDRMAYHERVRGSPDGYHYYVRSLLDDLIEGCRARSSCGGRPLELLVSFLATNPESCLFAPAVLRPRRVLLLYSSESQPHLEWVKRQIESLGCSVEEQPVDKLEGLVQRLANSEAPQEASIGIDVTPGPKSWSHLAALARPAALLFYLEHRWSGRDREPGHERLCCLSDVLHQA